MPTLVITKSYQDGDILLEADLDNIRNDITDFLNVTKLDADNIQDAAITTALLANDSVTQDKINADVAGNGLGQNISGALEVNVDGSSIEIASDVLQIPDEGIQASKIADEAITTAKIADNNVTTAKIADNNVTRGKLEAVGLQSDTLTTFSSSAGSIVDTGLSVNITTSGRPVVIVLTPSNGPNRSKYTVEGNQYFDIRRDGTTVSRQHGDGGATVYSLYESWVAIDAPSAGTYTYKIVAKPAGAPIVMEYFNFYVYEL